MSGITQAIQAALADEASVEARSAGARACEAMIGLIRRSIRIRSTPSEAREAGEMLCLVLAAVRIGLLTDAAHAFERDGAS